MGRPVRTSTVRSPRARRPTVQPRVPWHHHWNPAQASSSTAPTTSSSAFGATGSGAVVLAVPAAAASRSDAVRTGSWASHSGAAAREVSTPSSSQAATRRPSGAGGAPYAPGTPLPFVLLIGLLLCSVVLVARAARRPGRTGAATGW
ncbi:hypothetical protein CHMI_03269 [Cellulomonas hominis]|nr:hypothetical protein CHMI_03269 [Cellulomonas hominis]